MAEKSPGNSPLTPFVFNFADRAEVRSFMENNEPKFVGIDVATALEYANPHKALADHVDEDCLTIREVTDALGRLRETTVISEAGLYQLIMRSGKPEAKVFQRWVTHEVLPQLRKFGFYGLGRPLTANQTLAAQKLCVSLAEKLSDATDPGLRAVLYTQLTAVSQMLGAEVPSINDLGCAIEMPPPPWRYVIEALLDRLDAFTEPYAVDTVAGEWCLCVRTSDLTRFLLRDPSVAKTLATLPVKSDRRLKRDLRDVGLIRGDVERTIGGVRVAHLTAISIDAMAAQGVDVDVLRLEMRKGG